MHVEPSGFLGHAQPDRTAAAVGKGAVGFPQIARQAALGRLVLDVVAFVKAELVKQIQLLAHAAASVDRSVD